MRTLLALTLLVLSSIPSVAQLPYVSEECLAIFADRQVSVPEGVWRVTDGAVIAIVRSGDATDLYRILSISSPDLRIAPGTEIGTMRGADLSQSTYRAEMFSDFDSQGSLCSRCRYDFKFSNADGDNLLTITSVRDLKLRVSTAFKFILRAGISLEDTQVKASALRIYPEATGTPLNPEVL